MKYRNGTLYKQKHAVRFKHSTSLTRHLCPKLDSALHILPGCQHTQIRYMITERQKLIMQHDLQSHQQYRLPRILLCLHGYK